MLYPAACPLLLKWHIYRKWNERFGKLKSLDYKEGRAKNDPSVNWYKDELQHLIFTVHDVLSVQFCKPGSADDLPRVRDELASRIRSRSMYSSSRRKGGELQVKE